MKFQIALLLLLSLVGLSVQIKTIDKFAKLLGKNDLRQQYEQLNEQLEKSGADNLEDGIEVIKRYFESVKKEKKSLFGSSSSGNRRLTRAIEQFLELELVLSKSKHCNWDEFETVQKNVDGVIQFEGPANKIETLIMEATLRLANDCQKTYRANFKRLLAASSNNETYMQAYKYVAGVMDEITKAHFGGNLAPSADEMEVKFLEQEEHVGGEEDAEIVHKALQKLITNPTDHSHLFKVKDAVTGRMVVKRAKLGRIYEKYIIEPCNRFVDTFGPDVFMPSEMVTQNADHTFNESNEEMREFLRSWAHYRFCTTLVDDEGGNANEFLDDLYNYINNMKSQ